MPPRKPQKTLADYLVIGVSPVLIMLLVGSLVFFLIQVFYRGEMAVGIRWVLFWFVLAIVLVSRIGIEQGAGHATVYGAVLAAVTWLYLARTHPAYLLGLGLLAIVWWCAHKLTWDCTLIDDDDDASGHGLLQAAQAKAREGKATVETSAPSPGKQKAATAQRRRKPGRPFQFSDSRDSSAAPPGLWVVYFSLAALPLFGIGQVLLPGDEVETRRISFGFLVIYLVAALGLLLTTSFLGLRRYLRQRFLQMPAMIAFGWVRFGVGVAVVVLALALLPPRPGADYTWKTLAYRIDYRVRRASEYALRRNPPGEGPRRTSGQASKPEGQNGAGSGTDPQSTAGRSESAPPSRSDQNGEKQSPRPADSSLAPTVPGYNLLRSLLLLAAVVLLIGWLIRYRQLVLEMIRSIIAAVTQLFQGWLNPTPRVVGPTAAKQPPPKARPLAAYVNPFVTGKDRVWPPERLVAYSFEAVQAWAREQGLELRPQQTPREFCLELGEQFPEVASGLDRLAYCYGHAAYGRRWPDPCDLTPIRQLWRYLSESVAAVR